jgi:hypothetical protein
MMIISTDFDCDILTFSYDFSNFIDEKLTNQKANNENERFYALIRKERLFMLKLLKMNENGV